VRICAICPTISGGTNYIGKIEVCDACYNKYEGAHQTLKQNLAMQKRVGEVNAQNVAMDQTIENDTRLKEARARVRLLEREMQLTIDGSALKGALSRIAQLERELLELRTVKTRVEVVENKFVTDTIQALQAGDAPQRCEVEGCPYVAEANIKRCRGHEMLAPAEPEQPE
jgi:hypothetical protein